MNTRWWESYLIRYFPGFVVGSFCIFYFMFESGIMQLSEVNPDNAREPKLSLSSAQTWIAVAIIGVFYTYIVSAPITVFHYYRGLDTWIKRLSEKFWGLWAFSFVALCVVFLFFQNKITFLILVFTICLPSLYAFFSQYAILISVIFNKEYKESKENKSIQDSIKVYNQKIITARMFDESKEYRETYTHLREHANATFIVVLCVSMLFLTLTISEILSLMLEITNFSIGSLNYTMDNFNLKVMIFSGLIIVWIVPSVYLWGFANQLEKNLPEFLNTQEVLKIINKSKK